MTLIKVRKDQKIPYKNEQSPSVYDENLLLKNSLSYLKAELNKFKEMPLLVSEVKKLIGNKAIIRMPNGSNFLVNVAGDVKVNLGDNVLLEQRSLTIVQKLEDFRNFWLFDNYKVLN